MVGLRRQLGGYDRVSSCDSQVFSRATSRHELGASAARADWGLVPGLSGSRWDQRRWRGESGISSGSWVMLHEEEEGGEA